MNTQETKFLLRAYRPNGRDAQDPVFAQPLAQVSHDPALSAWFEREKSFDATVSAKLASVQPPAGLQAAILAGGRAGRRPQAVWRKPVWLAVAAAVAVLLTLAATLRVDSSKSNIYELTRFAVDDSGAKVRNHLGSVDSALEQRLTLGNLLKAVGREIDPAQLKAKGCRTVNVAGRDVFEICFGQSHEFHIYIAKRGDFDSSVEVGVPLLVEHGQLAAATWADSQHVYSVVTDKGMSALRQIL